MARRARRSHSPPPPPGQHPRRRAPTPAPRSRPRTSCADCLYFLAFSGMGLHKPAYVALYRKLERGNNAWLQRGGLGGWPLGERGAPDTALRANTVERPTFRQAADGLSTGCRCGHRRKAGRNRRKDTRECRLVLRGGDRDPSRTDGSSNAFHGQ